MSGADAAGPIRVGIDIRPLSGTSGRRGVGCYVRGLLAGLGRQPLARGDEVILFESKGEPAADLRTRFARVGLSRPRRAITFWDQLAWAPVMASRRLSVFHSPFYAVPRFHPPGCGIVQTIHDLTPLKLPGAVSRRNARIFRINFSLARHADRLIVPSAATRDDVVALLGVPESRIRVIPEAADVTPEDLEAAGRLLPSVLGRLGLMRGGSPARYLLHAGGHDKVKNLPRLLDAFARLRAQGRDVELIVAGQHGPETSAAMARAAALGVLDRSRFPGWLPHLDLVALYRGAAAVVYPSYAEGFGLPVIEAMACGAPVVTSDTGALRELAGSACLLAPPSDEAAIADAVARILDEPQTAAALSEAGRRRAAEFSWDEMARATLQVYREVAA